MNATRDDIISYRQMCDFENVQTLQRGMNFRLNPSYSVFLMSRRSNAPYDDHIHGDGVTLEYEGHDALRRVGEVDPKMQDQPRTLPSGALTQNGLFIEAVESFKTGKTGPELVKVYEKLFDGVWSLKGLFQLLDYRITNSRSRKVFRFILRLDPHQAINIEPSEADLPMTRIIPSDVKRKVVIRDKGRCVICGSNQNLHFDHDFPYSKGGTSLSEKNIRILCRKHNLQKSAKIE